MQYTQTILPQSQVKFTIKIPAETIRTHYKAALKEAIAGFSQPGFRPGHAPEATVLQKVGTINIWTDALNSAIPDVYISILTETKINAIGKPHVLITKIADESDAEIEITTAILPNITLPEYKKIATSVYAEKRDATVSDTEIDAKILELRKLRYQSEIDADHKNTDEEPKEVQESDLPELTDEYAIGFGGNINSVSELREKLTQKMHHDKIHQNEDYLRSKLMTELVTAVGVELPQILVDFEIDKMISQFEHDMTMSGVTLQQYLDYSKKSFADMRTELTKPATERALTQMILDKIADVESITPNAAKIETALATMNEQYSNTPDYNPESARSYIEQILGNQAVFAWLEAFAGYAAHDHEAMSQ